MPGDAGDGSDVGVGSPGSDADAPFSADAGAFAGEAGDDTSAESNVCSPPVPTPQVLSGELAQIDQECETSDGGLPPLVGPVDPSTVIMFGVDLPIRNMAALDERLAEISDPSSPEYRQYLTPAEYTSMFGPTQCDYDAVEAWATAKGLTVVMTYDDRELLDLSGPASAINAAFHVTMGNYLRLDGTMFFGPDKDPSVDLTVPLLAPIELDGCAVVTMGVPAE